MANVLFRKSHLSGLLKAVGQHIVDSVHTSILYEIRLGKEFTKPTMLKVSLGSQTSREPNIFEGISSHNKGPDTYCYELLINKPFKYNYTCACTIMHI